MSVVELRGSVYKVIDSEDDAKAALVPWSAWERIESILEGLERTHWARHPKDKANQADQDLDDDF